MFTRKICVRLLLSTLCLTLTGAVVRAEVSGTVKEAVTLTPIPGAIVTLQATTVRTTTAADGSFILPASNGTGLVIVGASKGYFNRGVVVDAPATGISILLDPVPQTDDPSYALRPPQGCGNCHPNQFNEWFDSPMAKAGTNTWVDDIYSGLGTPGGMGGFVYVRDSAFAGTNPNSECASCHQPEAWINTPFSALQDPTQPRTPEAVHGISCEVCHKVANIDIANVNHPGIFPGTVTLTRPAAPAFHQVQYGMLGDVDYMVPSQMRASYQPQLAAEVCAACHQDANDPAENHTYTGVVSEPTYLEWVATPYADPNSGMYASCVDCHMPAASYNEACAVLAPPIVREPGTLRSHTILGSTAAYLENAVEMTTNSSVVGNTLNVEVTIHNSLTGHHVPTGVTVRNMILLVEAWSYGGDPVSDSLTFTGTQTVHDLGGIGNPAQGYYAGLPGKLFAKVNHDASGNGPTFFTDATGIVFDNRIPALSYDVTNYSFALPANGGPVHIRTRLIYRRAFRFLVDAKQWTEDGHGAPLEDVLAPHYGHLMERNEAIIDATGAPIPAVSEWGLALIALLSLIAGTMVFSRVTTLPR